MKTTPSEYRVVVSNVGMVFRGLNRAKAMAEYEEAVMASKNFLSGRWHGEEVTLFEDDEILKEYDPGIQPAQPPITQEQHEYAFDVKLFAVVRVKACSLAEAIQALDSTVNAMQPTDHWIEGYNSVGTAVKITEASLSEDGDDTNRQPFEIDGESV